jgi:hypothetical protein
MQDWSHLWLSTTWQQSTSWTGPGMPAGAPSATAPRPNWRGGRRVQPALAEPSDLPGIASWRTPQPVSTGRERWSARDWCRGREGQGPRHRLHDPLRGEVDVEEVP